MAKAVLELEAVTGNWDGGIRKAQTALQNFIKTNGGLHSALAKDSQMMAEAIGKMGSMESKAATANARLRELESMFMELGSRFHEFTAAEKAGAPGQQTIKSMEELRGRILDVKKNMQDLQKQISLPTSGSGGAGFGQKFMQGLVPGFGMGVGAAGALAAVKGVQAVANLGKEAIAYNIRTNMEFEQSNANLSAVLGKTRDEMAALTENAKMLGASTLFTANQITELQTVLARRGFDENQILQMTHGISNLALATGTDLAKSAELAASTMQAFGMHANQMERIVSVLGVSTTKCALTTEKLGTSLQYVAPTARAAGFSLEDTVAMLGKLVDAGLDASTAGTSLRQIILAMSTDNGKLARSFGRPVRGINDFIEAMNHVSDAEDLLSDASKEVRVTAVPALISLANSKDGLKELRDDLEDVGGQLQEMADKQAATLTGQITLLSSAWDGFMINLGNSEGTLKRTVQWLQKMVGSWSQYVALHNGAQSAIGVVFGGNENHQYAQDPGQEYLNLFNEYKNSGKFDRNAKGKKYTEQEQADEINRKIREEKMKEYEAAKKVTDAEIAILDEYIKRRNEEVKYTMPNGQTGTMMYGIKNRQQLIQTVRPYDTEGKLSSVGASDIDGLIKVAAEILGGKQFADTYAKTIADLAEQSLATKLDDGTKKAKLSDKTPKSERFTLGDWRASDGLGRVGEIKHDLQVIENSKAFMSTAEDIAEADKRAEELKKELNEILGKEEKIQKVEIADNLDKKTLNGLMGIARSNKIGYDKVGIGGQMERIQAGIDIPDEEWQRIANSLNEELQKRGATWYISVDFESGTIEKLKTDIQETMEAFGSGIGAANSIVNAIDGVKSSFESMIETMQGDADVWDKMMSVWNAGMSVLQSIVTIYEAINTLKAVSAMLTGKETVATVAKVAADTADTEASGALAGTEVAQAAANEALAISSISAANAMMAEANAAKAAEYALIPGGIAALPGVLAALNGAYAGGLGAAKAASAIMYAADGGMAGNPLFKPRGTDTVPAMLSPGEIILNRAQQTNLAPQLQPSRVLTDGVHVAVTGRIHGKDILLSADNTNRALGGSRGVYSKIR